jgi:hypothetical protein
MKLIKCEVCGKEPMAGNSAKYCSLKCARYAESHKRMKDISKRANNMQKVKQDICILYGSKCAICGWQAITGLDFEIVSTNYNSLSNSNIFPKKFGICNGNEIHHIIQVSKGGTNDFENLILLCPNHHKLANMGMLSNEILKNYIKPHELIEEIKHSAQQRASEFIATILMGEEE